MSAYHDEAISNAERTLNPGERLVYRFKSKDQAHKEYMNLQRALKKRLLGGNVTMALKMLDISRNGENVILGMEESGLDFPAPVYLGKRDFQKENEDQCAQSAGVGIFSEKERILKMMQEDLAEGLMTQEDFDEQIKSLE